MTFISDLITNAGISLVIKLGIVVVLTLFGAWIRGVFHKPRMLPALLPNLSPSELISRSRIAIIDDDKPELIDDLKSAGYAVDHFDDVTKVNMHAMAPGRYDVVVLDFAGVGSEFGEDQGLSLLQYIRRTNPATVIIAYTGISIGTKHADFFRHVDFVLPKDAGIARSTEKIDEAIKKSLSAQNLWNSLLMKLGVSAGTSRDASLQNIFMRELERTRDRNGVKQAVLAAAGSTAVDDVADLILGKLIDIVQAT